MPKMKERWTPFNIIAFAVVILIFLSVSSLCIEWYEISVYTAIWAIGLLIFLALIMQHKGRM